ncbi:MAG: ankyrin repeat domain-containing protein, partial [Ottowia sp.]|nr:ankyrin repeat domain-containing protein [Ottowia sp.]
SACAAMLVLACNASHAEELTVGGILKDVSSSLKALAGMGDRESEPTKPAEKPAAGAAGTPAAKPAPQAAAKPEVKDTKSPEKKAETKPVEQAAAKAASSGKEKLLSSDPGNDRVDNDGRTALFRAACDGRVDSVRNLIEAGSNVNYARPSNQATALSCAAENGHADAVKLLLDSGADASATGNDKIKGYSPLLWAAKGNSLESVKLLLAAGANPNLIGTDGNSPLTLATNRNEINADLVSALLAAGADANHTDNQGNTPLHHAAYNGNQETVLALLEKGAKPSVLNAKQWSPIGYALDRKREKAILALLDAKQDLNIGGIPVLELALTSYNKNNAAYWNDVIKRLLDGGANANAIVQRGYECTWKGSTALMSAVACGRIEATQILIEGKADVNAAAASGDFNGLNALNIAIERKGHLSYRDNEVTAKKLAEMLRAAGAHE